MRVHVTIDKEGKATMAVDGVPGKRCLDATAGLEKALGGKVEGRQLTDDYTKAESVEQTQNISLGG